MLNMVLENANAVSSLLSTLAEAISEGGYGATGESHTALNTDGFLEWDIKLTISQGEDKGDD